MPARSVTKLQTLACETFPTLKRMYPTMKLQSPQMVLIMGDDNPFPGGFEKGDGKLSPDIP
jgi:hypothetical protein